MKMYKHLFLGLAVALATTLLTSCGGGGGGGSTVLPLSNTTRALVPGDEWTWRITGTASDGVDTVGVTGTLTQTVTSQTVTTPNAIDARVVLRNTSMTIDGTTAVAWERQYLTQDASGAIRQHGGENADGVYWVTTPATGNFICAPSPMNIGTSWDESCVLSNGQSRNDAYTVVATEAVNVPAGRVETYRYTGNGIFAGYPAAITGWYAPQIAAKAKITAVASTTDGVTMNLSSELTRNNKSIRNPVASGKSGDLFALARRALAAKKK